jgi:hypothetical protein
MGNPKIIWIDAVSSDSDMEVSLYSKKTTKIAIIFPITRLDVYLSA